MTIVPGQRFVTSLTAWSPRDEAPDARSALRPHAGWRLMRRIALMFIAALVALIGLVPLASAAQAVPWVEAAAYTYDTPAYDPPGNGAASERAQRAHGPAATAYENVDHWSRGSLARPAGLSTPSITTSAYRGMIGQPAQATPTAARQAVVVGELSSAQPIQDAARTVPQLPEGYSSFSAAERAMGSPGQGNVFDHVVEQSQIKRSGFAAEAVHNPFNMNPVSA